MKKNRQFLHLFTVSSTEFDPDRGIFHNTAGSFLNVDEAVCACAGYIIEHLERRSNLRAGILYSSYGDLMEAFMNHGMSFEDVSPYFVDDGSSVSFSRKVRGVIRNYLKRKLDDGMWFEIRQYGCCYRFDIDANDIESRRGLPVWVCVTSGVDEEDHEYEFERALPETFLSFDEARRCAVHDLSSYLEGYTERDTARILKEADDELRAKGHYEFALNDMKTRIWDVWRSPMNIGQGVDDHPSMGERG